MSSVSTSRDPYSVSLKLLENFVSAHPTHEAVNRLLLRAADISQSKLNNKEKFNELNDKLKLLNSEGTT